MRFRALHQVYAALNGYFWLPCPVCGQMFGGHEWKDYGGKSSSIPTPEDKRIQVAICPDCTKAGKGDPGNLVIWS